MKVVSLAPLAHRILDDLNDDVVTLIDETPDVDDFVTDRRG